MEPVSLGWTPLLTSWLNTLPATLSERVKDLRDMFLRFCPPLLHLIRRCGVKVRASTINEMFQRSHKRPLVSAGCYVLLFTLSSRPQEMIMMPDANLTRSVMHLFDCFLDDFRDEKYTGALSDLEMRGQVEVSITLQKIFPISINRFLIYMFLIHLTIYLIIIRLKIRMRKISAAEMIANHLKYQPFYFLAYPFIINKKKDRFYITFFSFVNQTSRR